MKLLAIASGAAVAAKDQMHSRAAVLQARHRLSGNAQVPRSASLRSRVRSQRFAATNLCLSKRCVQSVRGAAATRRAVPAFTAGSGGGVSNSCACPSRWRIGGQLSRPMLRCFALSHRFGSHRAVLPNPSLERTRTGMALGPRGVVVHHPPRGPSATPALAAQLKR
jgi:hypothetical protein